MAAAGDGFESMDLEGRIREVNEATCTRLGYSREELLGRPLADIDPAMDASRWREWVDSFGERSHVASDSVRRRKDGTIFPVEVTATVVGGVGWERVVMLVRDVSGRRQLDAVHEFLSRAAGGGSFGFPAGAHAVFGAAIGRGLGGSGPVGAGDGDGADRGDVVDDGVGDGGSVRVAGHGGGGGGGEAGVLFSPRGASQLFPEDAVLQELRAEGYVGVTLWGHDGKPAGLLAAAWCARHTVAGKWRKRRCRWCRCGRRASWSGVRRIGAGGDG